MKKIISLLPKTSIVALCLLFAACDKKVAKLETTIVQAPKAGFCDSITFNKHIKFIIARNCAYTGCHVTGGVPNADFTTYSGVNAKVANGSFKDRVFDSPRTMPASGRLAQPILDSIKCWLDKGAPNN
jgi:hypothetical protein